MIDTVLKVGGSLAEYEGLTDLCQEIGRLSAHHRLLVVPGGGRFADQVRTAYRRLNLGETTAHRMALLAMDQYGWLLGDLIPDCAPVSDLLSARRATENGRVPVLLPASLIAHADPLPHSWQVTSDTIAAWVALTAGSSRLVLLKDVDGLFSHSSARDQPPELISEFSVEQLAQRHGGVDDYLSKILASAKLEAWVINGSIPGRLTELLETGQTQGTHIPAITHRQPAMPFNQKAG